MNMNTEADLLPIEVIINHPQKSLGNISLDWHPQPGHDLNIEGQTYTVLERRQQYQLKLGRYHLAKIIIYVQPIQCLTERSFIQGKWVIGDASCRYNARSELIRCAINPMGLCQNCQDYEPINS
ncbi:MAG: DUF6464 family protein [Microcoleaceae cyanobacterium]